MEIQEAIHELLINGFLAGSEARYAEHVSPMMQEISGGQFEMGTSDERLAHFVGESPSHTVVVSPFKIASMQVTNELFSLFDERWQHVPAADRQKPAIGMTWFDAAVFAMWMGCRLPSEAEWEFACGGGPLGEWSCGEENLLDRYAWYSQNSGGHVHEVATREPNQFGLFDMHGNVWEWCNDGYDQDYYAGCPVLDPDGVAHAASNKVCRGGSFHALSEMCRTRYRFHDPPGFSAWDLGFRLSRKINPAVQEVTP